MLKEIKYLVFIIAIAMFIFLNVKYYFSDENKKRSYRSYESLNKKITLYSKQLLVLENDTNNIIEYVENKKNKKEKTYNFWDLLNLNEK